jgi:site-specific DNA recombinase
MKPLALKARTCAIYTRKSSEEGLEQNFNSLDAQREACEAYVKSQSHEGWRLSTTRYDDGGFSGGNLERPALQRLLADIRARQVQVIIVYKVDRLTRSLTDFARIVEQLDSLSASFVSITQQFNTTSSMGRLTLNVLLSFAQFEREVTGERIRDKIAASKRRGLWMGGKVPLGYEPNDRSLRIVPDEAKTVRRIFACYLDLKSVDALAAELHRDGTRSKKTTSRRGKVHGGASLSRGALYHMLSNPLYVGRIRHKEAVYPGQHPAIIEQAVWDKAQSQLQCNARKIRNRRTNPTESLLRGKLFDNQGCPMTPTYTKKAGGRRYKYYVSQTILKHGPTIAVEIPRIAAETIEPLVIRVVREITNLSVNDEASKRIKKVVLRTKEITIEIDSDENAVDGTKTIRVPVTLCRRGHETQILTADGTSFDQASTADPTIIRAMIRAYRWRQLLETGAAKSAESISRAEHVNATYVAKLLPLAYLAPDLTEEILQANQPRFLMLKHIRSIDIPLDWRAQRALFARYRAQ